jgi:hypothetical protein
MRCCPLDIAARRQSWSAALCWTVALMILAAYPVGINADAPVLSMMLL